jgi:hypothetical protein
LETDMLRRSALVLSLAMTTAILAGQAVSAQTNQGRSAKSLNARTAAPPSKTVPPRSPATGEKNWMDRASDASNSGGGGGGGM